MTFSVGRLLNIHPHEYSRIVVGWLMIFLTRSGFIIGSTILLASFLSVVGIELLPVFFLINALLVMIGTFLYRPLVHHVKREVLITYTVLYAAAFLIASVAFLGNQNTFFFVLFMIAQAIFVTQLSILISLFNEDLFTPLESQRTFPVIESAETLGGIIAGIVLSSLSHHVPAYKFVVVWVILLICILPIVLLFNPRTMEIPRLEVKEHHPHRKLLDSLKAIKKVPFLKGLLLVVLFHWAAMNIVEFQYTKALQELVANSHGDNYEADLVGKIGTLHVIFYSCALFIQLVVASRILTSLGVIWSMMLHPLVLILNVVGMTLNYNFATTALVKGGFEFTNILFKNGYDSSYYVIPHDLRDDAKEVMQGLMKPFGAILGTSTMMILAFYLNGSVEVLALNLAIIGLSALMFFFLWRLSYLYTDMCEHNLSHKNDLGTRLNAVEILGQKGHSTFPTSLQKILRRPQEPLILKEGILRTIALREDINSVEALLELLSDRNNRLRFASSQALLHFSDIKSSEESHAFTHYRVIHAMEDRLFAEKDERIREVLVACLFRMNPERFIELVLHALESEEGGNKAMLIRMLRLFHDPNLKHYLLPSLEDKDPKVKGASLIALWPYKDLHTTLHHHLYQMLESPKRVHVLEGIRVAGEVQFTAVKPFLSELIHSSDAELQKASLLALAQMEDSDVIPHLVRRFLDPSHEWFEEMNSILSSLPTRFEHLVRQSFHAYVSDTIHMILKPHLGKKLGELEHDTLKTLHTLYTKISAHHEAHQIQKLLDSREDDSL